MNSQDTPHITHVCICFTQYALLQYLLLTDEDTARHHTFYIFNEIIAPDIQRHFPTSVCFPTETPHGAERWKRKGRIVWLSCFRYWQYPFLRTAKLYFSGVSYLSVLVRGRSYDLLQEAPYYISFHANPESTLMQRERKRFHSWRGKLKYMLMGPTTLYECLYKSHIDTIHLTEPNTSPTIDRHHVEVRPFADLWKGASESKKQYIREVFGIAAEQAQTESRTMFLTQPLVNDGILTSEEYINLLRRIFALYDTRHLLIKKHPRDTFDYSAAFPDIALYDKKVNMELLLLTGMHISKVIALCSTVVNSLPADIEVDWFGAAVHPKIEQYLGNTIKPQRPFRQMTL